MGRSDGKRLKGLGVEYEVAAHVMDHRYDAMNMIHLDIPMEPMRKYMNRKRKEGKRYDHLTLIIAAMIRAMAEYPALNRFVVNKRIYARNDLEVGMVVLKEGRIDAEGTTSKMKFDPSNTIDEVNETIKSYIESNRKEDEVNSTDKLANILCSAPGLLRVVANLAKWLDKHNMCPKAIIEASPFHCTIMLTNLASIKTNYIYHHIYDFGTVSMSLAIGMPHDVPMVKKGEQIFVRCLPIGLVMDERIASGAYFALAFRKFSKYLENPEILEQPPEKVVKDKV